MQVFHDLKAPKIQMGKWYPAIVVENNDKANKEDKLPLGRVKIRIPALFDNIEDDFLPWAVPHVNRLKGGPDNGSFSVPAIGVEVLVQFQAEDPYNPFYAGFPYSKNNVLSVLTKDDVDNSEYPKKHVIYSFDNGNLFTVNDDYSDDELRFKLYLKNVGNVQVWCGRNFDQYVKDNYDLVVAGKLEVHANATEVREIMHLPYTFTAEKDSYREYQALDHKVVHGLTSHSHGDKTELHFGKGMYAKVEKGNLIIDVADQSKILVNSKGQISVVTEANVSVNGKNITVEASESLKLRGSSITKSTEIEFESGESTEERMKAMIKEEIKKYMAENPNPSDSSSSTDDATE